MEAVADVPLWHSVWNFLQQVATFAVALIAIWAGVVRPWLGKVEKKRKTEAAARDDARRQEIKDEIEEVVAPLRDKVDAIHHTTTVNGGQNNPPTLRDEVSKLRAQQETAIKAVGAVAVNQAHLASRFDQHEREGEQFLRATREALAEQGIQLPEVPTSLPPRFDADE